MSLCSVGRRGPSLQASAAPNQARESKAMSEPQVVRYEVEDGIGVITIDNPPVNALGPGVREGIIDAVGRGTADPGVSALVLIGAGRSFIAGADIRQFGKARTLTTGQSTKALDESAKPVVAAIHGYALGGGLEHALACHYRIAVPSAKVGPARSADRHPAGRRRHAAAAATHRAESRDGDDRERASRAGAGGEAARNYRRDRGRQGPARRRNPVREKHRVEAAASARARQDRSPR